MNNRRNLLVSAIGRSQKLSKQKYHRGINGLLSKVLWKETEDEATRDGVVRLGLSTEVRS